MKAINIITGWIMILNTLAVGVVAYLAFWPFEVITVEPQPYVLASTDIHPGEYISYTFHYCKNYDVKAEIIHQLSGAMQVRLPDTPQALDLHDQALRLKELCGTTTKAVYIPVHTPPGEYEMYEYVDYRVTPLQTVSYVFKTEPFTVTK